MQLKSRLAMLFSAAYLGIGSTSLVARADWTVLEMFEGLTLDAALDGQNGWTAPESGVATRRVVVDPAGGPNQVLSMFGFASAAANLYKPATIAGGATGTLHFRMYIPDYDETMVNGPSVGIGMDNVAVPTGSPNLAGPFIVPDGNSGLNEITIDIDTSSASNFVPLDSLSVETWYSVWMVIDNANAMFELYVQGGAFATPTILDQPGGATAHTYRTPSVDDLLSVWIRPNADHGDAPGQTMYFDDIYLDATASNLTDPNAPAFPPGDANQDGVVDIFDVNLVSDHWGQTGPEGDVNGDSMVDIFDVNLISDHWGETSGGVAAVPEPAALGLLILGAAAFAWVRRRTGPR